MIEKQLKGIRKLAKKFYDKNPEHFGAVIAEIDSTLDQMREDSLLYIEALEEISVIEYVDLREVA